MLALPETARRSRHRCSNPLQIVLKGGMPEQKLKCVEPGCDKEVVYEREVDHGALDVKEERIYLTCAGGHTHPYMVWVPG